MSEVYFYDEPYEESYSESVADALSALDLSDFDSF